MELVFVVEHMRESEKKAYCDETSGTAAAPQTERHVSAYHFEYISAEECCITVKDLGFGEMFPASGQRMERNDQMAGGDCVSGYILCQTGRAEAPYFIENISMNIYSLEELCYYLDHNLYLIDQTILNEGLCNWIQEELKLPALAAKLRPKMGKFASAEDLVYPVFKEINYLTYEELKVLNTRLQKFDKETPAMREKCKGDALMENKMYVHAIQVYQKLLDRKDLEEIREGLTECIYHNLGCAYSYLFQMDKAIECFRRAYEGGRSTEALETYLMAFSMSHSEDEYKNMAKTLGVEEEILTAVQNRKKEFSQIPREKVNSQNMDDILNHLTSEYHRSTGS